MNNKIDVIIPVKERFSLLLNALKTIDLQTLKPEKVWIIDDCSVEKIGISATILSNRNFKK